MKPSFRNLSEIIYVQNTEKFNEGQIVSIGDQVYEAKVGDHIKYGNGSYLDWPIKNFDGQDYQIIQEADIACIVEQ